MPAPIFIKSLENENDYDGNPQTATRISIDIDGDSIPDIQYVYDGDIDPETKRTEIEADLIARGYIWV